MQFCGVIVLFESGFFNPLELAAGSGENGLRLTKFCECDAIRWNDVIGSEVEDS